MRRRPLAVAATTATMLVVGALTVACHPGASTSSIREMATCSPSGTNLRIVAQNLRFNRDCLAAPAGQAFILTLDNEENGIPHNVSIYPNGQKSRALFKGEIVTGVQSTTYQVRGLPAGIYFFQCDVHPDMNGAFVVV
jgi:plastocyanin